MTPIRLLLFLHTLEPFGAQRTALGIAEHLDPKAFNTTVCFWWGEETLRSAFEKRGAHVVTLKARRIWDPLAFGRLVRVLKEKRIHIIHAHVPEMGVIGWVAGKLAGVPVICFTMNNPPDKEPAVHRRWHIWAAPKERVGMIYNAIAHPDTIPRTDEKTIRKIREEVQCNQGEKLLVCVARLTEQKGHTVLLEAFRKIRDQGHPVKLALVGDGELEPVLRRQASSLKLDRHICWMGRRNDVYDVLQSSDIYVSTSRWEGLNISMLEAMAIGLPVVASDIGGHIEAVQKDETALLVPGENPGAFADAVGRLLEDNALARSMGEKGRQRVQEHFTTAVMSQCYQEVYRELLSQKGVK
jgi:glycosyltransferase involved in cell wall biosynthesis